MFRDISGGRVAGHEKELRKARDRAIEEMVEEACAAGADGVLGVDLDCETINGPMLMVTATRTAVRFSR